MSAPRDRARRLRQDATDVERLLWLQLRDRRLCGAKFRRQRPVGRYVVDFVCLDARLVIELDGGQHDAEDHREKTRTNYLEDEGYQVLRYWNNQVLENMGGVLETIAAALKQTSE